MANKKRIVPVAAAFLVAVSLTACQGAGTGNSTSGTESSADTKSDDEVLDDYAGTLEGTLKDKFGDNYKVERDGLFVNASVWKDGSAKLVKDTLDGDAEAEKKWKKELDELQKFSQELGYSMEATGVKNGHVVLSLMDEKNQKRMLAMLSDGVVIFDETTAAAEAEKASQAGDSKKSKKDGAEGGSKKSKKKAAE